MPTKAYTDLLAARTICASIGASAAIHARTWGGTTTMREGGRARNSLLEIVRIDMVDFIKLTKAEADELGFRESPRWPGLHLIPAWAWWVIPAAGCFEAVSGERHTYHIARGELPSTDIQGGYLCFGVRFDADGSMHLGN